jgi:hypothetical protein
MAIRAAIAVTMMAEIARDVIRSTLATSRGIRTLDAPAARLKSGQYPESGTGRFCFVLMLCVR